MSFNVRQRRRIEEDGSEVTVTQLECPGCGIWGDIDDDQLHGRVSVDCPECPFHETHDFTPFLT